MCALFTCRPERFDSARGFMAILKILKDYQNIDVSWEDNYNRRAYRNTPSKSYSQ